MPTEILIFGAGAVGAFYGSRLAQVPNTSVSCVCRSNYSAVNANGFSVTSPQYGEARNSKVNWDYIVVSTKALPDVSDDSAQLEGLVGEGTSIVLIQNGLGVEEPYKKRFPQANVLSAVTIVSAVQDAPGQIKHNRWTRINVGPYLPESEENREGVDYKPLEETHQFNTKPESNIKPQGTLPAQEKNRSDVVEYKPLEETRQFNTKPEHNLKPQGSTNDATAANDDFVRLLVEGGIKDASAYSHAKLQLVRWHKIAINASMNPSSVLSNGATNSAMSHDPELHTHLKGVMDEVLTTAPKVLGVPFPAEFATADRILKSTQKNTSGSRPSMWGIGNVDRRWSWR
ncbi:hypothetical protein H2203_004647 [Taxawa tesnikishii (nom. ined.)]|nr:hypothetical protein H2203_004647 [Dothideales sp. JES 119]